MIPLEDLVRKREVCSRAQEMKRKNSGNTWDELEASYQKKETLSVADFESDVMFGVKAAFEKESGIKNGQFCVMENIHYPHCLASTKLIPLLEKSSIRKSSHFKANKIEQFQVSNKKLLNDIFYGCFEDKIWREGGGGFNNDLSRGPLEGGMIKFLVDDAYHCTVKYNWSEQHLSIKCFLEKYSYKEKDNKVILLKTIC